MKVEALMTWDVHTCRPDDSLSRAAQLMWDHDCGSLPVIDDEGRIVGMITDRDICMAAYTRGNALERIAVRSAMAQRVYTCQTSDTVREAESIMRAHSIRRLPVVDMQERLLGLVSLNDIAREAKRAATNGTRDLALDQVALTLGTICERRGPRAMTVRQ